MARPDADGARTRALRSSAVVLVRSDDAPEILDELDALVMRKLVRAEHGPDISVTWVRLSGRHRRLLTRRSTRVYYVLDGSATFVVGDGPELEARRGDVVVVPRGTPYEFRGETTYLVVNAPAFVEGDDVYDE
jgi:mannose-6-phosphate isomerase-like protein (cupin superfamily)